MKLVKNGSPLVVYSSFTEYKNCFFSMCLSGFVSFGQRQRIVHFSHVSFSKFLSNCININQNLYYNMNFQKSINISSNLLIIDSCTFFQIFSSAVICNSYDINVGVKKSFFEKCISTDSGGGMNLVSNSSIIYNCCFILCKCGNDVKWGSGFRSDSKSVIDFSSSSAHLCPKVPDQSWEISFDMICPVILTRNINVSDCNHQYVGGINTKSSGKCDVGYSTMIRLNTGYSLGIWVLSGQQIAHHLNFIESNNTAIIRTIFSDCLVQDSVISRCIGAIADYYVDQIGKVALINCSIDTANPSPGRALISTISCVFYPNNRTLNSIQILIQQCGTNPFTKTRRSVSYYFTVLSIHFISIFIM